MSNQNFGGQKAVYSQSFMRSDNRRDGQPRREGGRNIEPSEDSDVIQVEARNLGWIIGSKGANIKKMESESGAEIQVSKDRDSPSVDVFIRGTQEAKSAARELIKNCVDDHLRRNNDHNQSRSGGYNSSRRSDGYQSRGQYDNHSQGGFDNQPQGGFYDQSSFDNQSHGGFDNQPYGGYNRQPSSGGYQNERRSYGDANQHDDRSNQYDRRSQYNDRDRRNNRNDNRDDNRNSNSNQNYGRSNNASNFGSNSSYNDNQRNAGYSTSQYNNQDSKMDSGNTDFQPIDWEALYAQSEQQAALKLASLPPIVKNLYQEDPQVANMSPQEVAIFRANNMDIKVERVFGDENEKKKPILNPVRTFEQAFRPYPEILQTVCQQNFTVPSPIQSQAWPIILSGEDLIGIAQTGTGKTLAFLLPALIHIESQTVPRNQRAGPTVLILSPTRELALQIEKEINKYSYRGIKCVCVYGGGARREQGNILAQKPEIVVATPGRLEDFISTDQILLESVTYVVLDEADKMLEMGFEVQIRRILLKVRGDRQSIMTSATWPSGVRRLVSQYSNNPVQVVVGSLDLTAVHSVSQRIEIIDEDARREYLDQFLAGMEPDDKVIVFCSKKSVTDDIASDLMLKGVKCQSIHGDREQCDREQALQDLKTGEVHILIATDVAARGIDIPDITHIFNYDFPRNIEEYVHRIGRTGRAGKSGESISLVTRKDWGNAAELIKILEEANQGVPEELRSMADRFEKKKSEGGFRGGGGRGGRGRGGRGGRPRY